LSDQQVEVNFVIVDHQLRLQLSGYEPNLFVCNNVNEQYPNLSCIQQFLEVKYTLLNKETEGVELAIVHGEEEPLTTITTSSAHWQDQKSF
jgi:hypothetical protein